MTVLDRASEMKVIREVLPVLWVQLTLIYMGYFDYLFYTRGGGGEAPLRSNSGI